MENKAKIDIRCPEVNTPFKMVVVWIVVTGEYGKPSDKYLDDFLDNFTSCFQRSQFSLPEDTKTILDENFLVPEYTFTGGFEFYAALCDNRSKFRKHNAEIALRDFIKSWQPATKI